MGGYGFVTAGEVYDRAVFEVSFSAGAEFHKFLRVSSSSWGSRIYTHACEAWPGKKGEIDDGGGGGGARSVVARIRLGGGGGGGGGGGEQRRRQLNDGQLTQVQG